jgi:glycerol-3-phosphate acyltransferase PlsY
LVVDAPAICSVFRFARPAELWRLWPNHAVSAERFRWACQGPQWAHTRGMGRIIGTILGAILAIWLAFTAAGGIAATLKTFLVIGLIAMAVFVVVWLVAKRGRRG